MLIKSMWLWMGAFLPRNVIMVVACVLAMVSSIGHVPQLSYIDFSLLGLLFCLMIVVNGFKQLKILDYLAVHILKRCVSLRTITAALVGITFFVSMLVTNDVAVMTFVPLSLVIGNQINMDMAKIIVWQTLAANLGSALMPMGSPHNLFIYAHYSMSPWQFLSYTLLLVAITALWLGWLVVHESENPLDITLESVKVGSNRELYMFICLFVLALLGVFRLVDYRLVVAITIICVGVFARRLFFTVDYSLLITFVGFFIFIGNVSHLPLLLGVKNSFMGNGTGVYCASILVSQIISNVPAAILLSGFTDYSKELLLGVNVGGLGTLIASMASVISYKLYVGQKNANRRAYLNIFTYYNIMGVIVLGTLIYLLEIR